MATGIPSENIILLQHFLDRSIVKVSRQLLKSDMNLDDFEQMADGPTEIQLDDGTFFSLYALSEIGSIGIQGGKMKQYGDSYTFVDVTNNDFWRARVGKKIKSIEILQSKYASPDNPSEFGIKLGLESSTEVNFEYLDEEDYPDTIRVVAKYIGPDYLRKQISSNDSADCLGT
jgi:hypothetical protein